MQGKYLHIITLCVSTLLEACESKKGLQQKMKSVTNSTRYTPYQKTRNVRDDNQSSAADDVDSSSESTISGVSHSISNDVHEESSESSFAPTHFIDKSGKVFSVPSSIRRCYNRSNTYYLSIKKIEDAMRN